MLALCAASELGVRESDTWIFPAPARAPLIVAHVAVADTWPSTGVGRVGGTIGYNRGWVVGCALGPLSLLQ